MKEIKVVFIDDSEGFVKETQLNALITSGRLKAFLRSDGWVRVGIDPVREIRFKGRDRRKVNDG
ncbi:MAG: hypothetical protein PHD01_06050 [Geobacteraceae bacterium]|nr:hypothetical protein [Geobacteraceae bacterium]